GTLIRFCRCNLGDRSELAVRDVGHASVSRRNRRAGCVSGLQHLLRLLVLAWGRLSLARLGLVAGLIRLALARGFLHRLGLILVPTQHNSNTPWFLIESPGSFCHVCA